jgi:hypothetical protein
MCLEFINRRLALVRYHNTSVAFIQVGPLLYVDPWEWN